LSLGKIGTGRVDEQGNGGRLRNHLMQQLQPLRSSKVNVVVPVRLPPGRFRLATIPSSRGRPPRKTQSGWPSSLLCRQCRWSSCRDNHSRAATNQVGCQHRQLVVLTLRPAIFERRVYGFIAE
jgi:hypothetical protein